jgi:hypothetical protein
MNSYNTLPEFTAVIKFDDPSPPVTLSATITADGIVIVCATSVISMSSIILPNLPVPGKFENAKVIAAVVVAVW